MLQRVRDLTSSTERHAVDATTRRRSPPRSASSATEIGDIAAHDRVQRHQAARRRRRRSRSRSAPRRRDDHASTTVDLLGAGGVGTSRRALGAPRRRPRRRDRHARRHRRRDQERLDVRVDFGAVQNRLEHRLNNLATYQENLTASESRIRDVDMAAEMVNFTKLRSCSRPARACSRRPTRPRRASSRSCARPAYHLTSRARIDAGGLRAARRR